MTEAVFPQAFRPLRSRNLLAVASGKGGVGKTWFSITLAHALARKGRRVLLFDGDLGLANVDIQLGLSPKRDLGAVIDGLTNMAGATERFADGGFDVLAGRSGSGSLANLPSHRLGELRNELLSLAANYDDVIVDLGAGIDRTVRNFAGPAGTTLVVTTDEPTALTDAYAFIKVVHATVPSADLRVVVNMAQTPRDGERTYGTLLKASQNFLKYAPQLAGIVRRDQRVRETIRFQTPLLTRSPGSEAAQDVEAIAAKLALRDRDY
ncbi:MAG TPA: MinD/ParA family protein [Alphaproteobacteria bacterium]|nr:MinD/ParA family protein [Alphaproteobacteria bacterium]